VFSDPDAFDDEGVDRPSLEVARSDAIAGARNLIANSICHGKPVHRDHRIEITNEAGVLLDTVQFGDVIDLRS
jgi:hypothetical protein